MITERKRSRLRVLSEEDIEDAGADAPVFDMNGEQLGPKGAALNAAAMAAAAPLQEDTLQKAIAALEPVAEAHRYDRTAQLVLLVLTKTVELLTERVANAVVPLLSLIGGFILWRQIMVSPTNEQLIGLGLYGVFALLLTLTQRRH